MVALQLIAPVALASVALGPVIASMWASSRFNELEQLMRAVATLAMLAALGSVLFVAVFGREVLGLAFGDEYRSAYGPLVILSAGNAVVAGLGFSIAVLLMTGFERVAAQLSVACIIVGAAAMSATAHLLGPTALAIASSVTASLFVVLGAVATYLATGMALVPMGIGTAIRTLRRERCDLVMFGSTAR
jgi:O-antigen/teichoic acid export membrane protein